jgi:hypothetical protein
LELDDDAAVDGGYSSFGRSGFFVCVLCTRFVRFETTSFQGFGGLGDVSGRQQRVAAAGGRLPGGRLPGGGDFFFLLLILQSTHLNHGGGRL